jgi:hypothetical protein
LTASDAHAGLRDVITPQQSCQLALQAAVKAARAGFPATGIDQKTALIELSCLGALQNPQFIYI